MAFSPAAPLPSVLPSPLPSLYYYMHTPKTGGTSLCAILKELVHGSGQTYVGLKASAISDAHAKRHLAGDSE